MANVGPCGEAGLHLVRHQDDAVLVADPPEPAHELGGRDDEAASPCTGSMTIAATSSAATRVGVLERLEVGEGKAVGLGREGAEPALYGCVFDVRLSASSVRPWKAPSKAITAGRFV